MAADIWISVWFMAIEIWNTMNKKTTPCLNESPKHKYDYVETINCLQCNQHR